MYRSKQSAKELRSRYNWLWKQIVISFEKQTKNRLSLKIQFKIVFLLLFTGSRKKLKNCLPTKAKEQLQHRNTYETNKHQNML